MALAAAGCLSLTLDKFRDTLAASATFQELMDADTVAEAKAVTWWLETDDHNEPTQAELPRAVVAFSMGQFEGTRVSTTGWGTNSPVEVLIEVEAPAEYADNMQDRNMWFLNKIGAIIDEVKVLATSGGGYSNVTSFILEDARATDPTENGGKVFCAAFLTARLRGL